MAGMVLLLAGGAIKAVGLYLTYLALHWTLPDWVPGDWALSPAGPELPLASLRDSPVGLAAVFLIAFGGVAGLNGLWMLVLGRRNWVLVTLLLLLFVVFVSVGVWALVDGEGMIRQLGG